MRAKKARREEADAIRKKIEEQEAKNAHALKELSKKQNKFPVMLYMNSDELYIVFCWFSFVHLKKLLHFLVSIILYYLKQQLICFG